MKLRYYLRGLGIGMVVTALILGISSHNDGQETLSDAQIRQRAAELGMVDSGSMVLSELATANQAGEAEQGTATGESTDAAQGTETGESMDAAQNADAGETADAAQNAGTGENAGATQNADAESAATEAAQTVSTPLIVEQIADNSDMLRITIVGGYGSRAISRGLEEAGLVQDAVAFDRYVCSKGYSRYIAAGTYNIPLGISEEELAEIIVKINAQPQPEQAEQPEGEE